MPKDKSKSKKNAKQVESSQTKQATSVAIEQVTLVPETISKQLPKPDYPRYRVQSGNPINLADFDADLCEIYRKKKGH